MNTTSQRDNGSWYATVNGVDCTHKHSSEKKALDCIEWETKTLARTGQSAWAREAAKASKSFANFADLAADEELVPEDARSHQYVPMPGLLDLWHAVTTLAQTSPAGNLLFVGPSGSGKTDGARDLAARVGLPFTKVDAASMTDPESWFGTRELVAQDGAATTVYSPSTFVEAVQKPGVLLIDEISRVRDEHRNVLIPLLDHTRAVLNPLTGQVVTRHPMNFIIMAGNVGINFTGTNAIDPAFWSRAIVVEFDYIEESLERAVVMDASGCDLDTAHVFVRLATETRAKARISDEINPVSTRELIAMGQLVKAGLDRDAAVKYVVLNAASAEGGTASVRQEIQNMWNGVRVLKAEKPADPSQPAWVCPTHGQGKDIPAGTSAKTGKPYKAFRACPQYGCQNTSDRTPLNAPVNPATTTSNGVSICGDCNSPQPAGRSTFCVHCGATL